MPSIILPCYPILTPKQNPKAATTRPSSLSLLCWPLSPSSKRRHIAATFTSSSNCLAFPHPPSVSTSPSVPVFKFDYVALVAFPERPLVDLDMPLYPPPPPPHVTANISLSSLLCLPFPSFFSFELNSDH
ncbi:hypothetical protein PIB30_080538 [Stylosanthes scabra]|uniref:Uncharacterized protein n=1 Tax=Stylosanthes scabra TaxID=79078 RepID=A0ABU6TQZ4_9FABA|nr:hypothetical protein [Stylosanthes scabra]